MPINESRKKEQSEVPQMRSGWWLLPSFICGATIWGMVIVALVG